MEAVVLLHIFVMYLNWKKCINVYLLSFLINLMFISVIFHTYHFQYTNAIIYEWLEDIIESHSVWCGERKTCFKFRRAWRHDCQIGLMLKSTVLQHFPRALAGINQWTLFQTFSVFLTSLLPLKSTDIALIKQLPLCFHQDQNNSMSVKLYSLYGLNLQVTLKQYSDVWHAKQYFYSYFLWKFWIIQLCITRINYVLQNLKTL